MSPEQREEVERQLLDSPVEGTPETPAAPPPSGRERKPRGPYTRRKLKEDLQVKEDADIEETAQAFGFIGTLLLHFIARRMPDPLPPTEVELVAMNSATERLAKKYLKTGSKYAPEILFGGTVAMFGISRLSKPKVIVQTEDLNAPPKVRTTDANQP